MKEGQKNFAKTLNQGRKILQKMQQNKKSVAEIRFCPWQIESTFTFMYRDENY